MTQRRESGAFNRSGRRGGGYRAARLAAGLTSHPDARVLGPCCLMGRHTICAGCDCTCHGATRTASADSAPPKEGK